MSAEANSRRTAITNSRQCSERDEKTEEDEKEEVASVTATVTCTQRVKEE